MWKFESHSPSHVVERWREILLWSWVVGRIGGDNGEWTTDLHRTRAWTELGGVKPDPVGLVQEPQVKVGLSLRETLDHDTVLDVLGSQSATTYSFCKPLFPWSCAIDGLFILVIVCQPRLTVIRMRSLAQKGVLRGLK